MEDDLLVCLPGSRSTAAAAIAAIILEKGADSGSAGKNTGGNTGTDQGIARRGHFRQTSDHGVLIVQVGKEVVSDNRVTSLSFFETL